jgi:hypothetical protein
MSVMLWAIHPESTSEMLEIIHSIESVIHKVDPDLVLVDSLFGQARDAVIRLKRKYVLLSPNTLQELALPAQGLAVFRVPW